MGQEGFISDSIVDQIRQGSNIVEVISGYLSLTKAGSNFKGLCPFHQEKTPSFSVSPSKQMFHCFGCGEGGDVFHFLMKIESLPFPEVLRKMADSLGITIPRKKVSGDLQRKIEKQEKLWRIHEDASEHYQSLLAHHPDAENARSYLKSRGLLEKDFSTFSLGFSLRKWSDLMVYLEKKGWKKAELEDSGLILSGQHGFYDRFRGRLIFPIFDSHDRIVGFGGRVLDDSMPKYLNSPETLIFKKGQYLYGFGWAKGQFGKQPLVVVEGYLDVITGHLMGLNNMVGTMGTALTPHHLQQIGRYTREVVLVFDSDFAGQQAAMRAGQLFLDKDWTVRIVSLPAKEDPDSFLRKFGKEAFEDKVRKAAPIMDFLIQGFIAGKEDMGIQEKARVSRQLFQHISKLSSTIERGFYLKQLAETLGVSEKDLLSDFSDVHRKREKNRGASVVSHHEVFPKDEEILLHLLVHGQIEEQKIQAVLDGFSHDCLKRLVHRVLKVLQSSGKLVHERVLESCSEEENDVRVFSRFMMQDLEYDDIPRTIEDCLGSIRRKKIQMQIKVTEKAIESAEKEGDLDAVRNLQKDFIQLRMKKSYPEVSLAQ